MAIAKEDSRRSTGGKDPGKQLVRMNLDSKKHRYRKEDKAWEPEDIDKWTFDAFDKTQYKHGVIEESSFNVLFPKYRESYLSDCWEQVKALLKPHGVEADLDLREGVMTVTTTRKMFDPYMICRARDFCKLLARCVGFAEASKIISDDNLTCDVVKIGTFTRSKEKFIKRRERFVGPNGSTLKALEILTECYFFVQGTTISIIGPWRKMKMARRVVEDCMSNKIHPVYLVKELMVKRELFTKEDLKGENWSNYLPKFKKTTKGKKNKVKIDTSLKLKKVYPEEQSLRNVDKLMDTGEYFLNKKAKNMKDMEKSTEQRKKEIKESKMKSREKTFTAPNRKKGKLKGNPKKG